LESAQEQVQALWGEEDGAFENRSPPSKKTSAGEMSGGAADLLCEAREDIQNAIDHMQRAIGDASLPEPPEASINRRV
jgi:hypothetical protein